ncbi:MAG: hypothetical protein Q4G50_00590 [Corynebacterium sp.]|uniref:hypothetical protein n=1 Tax=Corynebacterium sp. TaxID=1720 RepID=UPI0026E10D48|nr:hypothetical protein [Corynebacterium sp.]MDO5668480.1 hypothetical protein [Corynebacterium sp.]
MSASIRHWITALLLVVPLVVGAAVAAATHLDPAATWSSGDEPAAAPAPIASQELIDARRAAGEAGSQAGFLTTGTGELAEGVAEMRTGAEGLPEEFNEAVLGAQQLHQGLVELQAGVGQLGTGAGEVADGVGGAVDQVIGLGALRGQLLAAIDDTTSGMEGVSDPDVVEAREQLLGLRGQVELIELDGEVAQQLQALKDGSREIANQLGVPGYAFHDGIYSATQGAQELSYGLTEAQGGIGEAISGVEALDEGAQRIDDMASRTQDRITAVQRALPAVQAADAESEQVSPALSPLFALLIAALVMVGGAFAGAPRRPVIALAAILGLTVAGVVLLWLVGAGLGAGALGLGAVVLASGAAAAAVSTHVLMRLFGGIGGSIAAGVLGLVQLGIVGWVWKTLTTTEVSAAWQVAANLFPLGWGTAGLTAAGNDGTLGVLWLSLGVLGAMAVLGVGAVLVERREAARRSS